jgi:predicted HD phosphohydrolase
MRPEDALPEPQASWFVRPDGHDASGTIHGLGHTRRVMIHASELAETLRVVGWEREALVRAALWHDIGRTHDGADYYHGAKSAGRAVALGLHRGLEPEVYQTALYAITHHCGGEQYGLRAAEYLFYYHPAGDGQECGEVERRQVDPEAAVRVFKMLKDADALDRVRLGDLDPSMLRFPESRERVPRAWDLLDRVR